MNHFFLILLLSVLSGVLAALFIFFILYVYIQKFFKKKIEYVIDEYIEIFKNKLRESFQEAGKELLPSFKSEVKKGFKEAIQEVFSPNMIDDTAKQIAKTSSSLIQNSLHLLLGKWTESDKP